MRSLTDLPAPLTPPTCDLRGLEWMPMYGDRLLGSDTWLMAGVEARAAMFPLWWGAWKQCPAGSLPDQDRALAQIAGYGSAVAAWQAVRDEALRGWVLCSDGRLYHPTVCALALDAMERRTKERERKATWRSRKPGQNADVTRDKTGTERGQDAGRDADETRTERGSPADVPADRTGQDRKEDTGAIAPDAGASPATPELFDLPPEPRSVRAALWADGLPIMRNLLGKSDAQCRVLLGKLLRDTQDDCARLYRVLREAESLRPADPLAWLHKAAGDRSGAATGKAGNLTALMNHYRTTPTTEDAA